MTSNVLRWRWWWLRPQFRDEPQNLLEHLPWDGDLGHLEDNIAAVAHYLRADLDQLVLQTRQRPVLDRLRRRQRAQEIAEIVGEGMKLEPHRVCGERSARQSRPLDRAFALLDPLRIRRIVEGCAAYRCAVTAARSRAATIKSFFLFSLSAFPIWISELGPVQTGRPPPRRGGGWQSESQAASKQISTMCYLSDLRSNATAPSPSMSAQNGSSQMPRPSSA